MKGKNHVFVLIFCMFLSAQAYGQTSSPIDLVLLLDTSSGMSSSYDHVNNYISGPFLNEYLRVGDTFHLISFASNPRLDAARRISGVGDVETIIGRMFLQYPVERGANVGAAISYAEQYIISLPIRPKKIVLISTGGSDTNNLVTSAKSRLSSRNTTLDYIQVTPGQPLSNLPKSGRPAASSTSTTRPSSTASGAGTTQSTGTSTTSSASSGSTTQATQSTQSTQSTSTQTETGRPKAGATTSGTGTTSSTDTRGTQTDIRGTTSTTDTGKTTTGTASGSTSTSTGSADSKQDSNTGKKTETTGASSGASDKTDTKKETSGSGTSSTSTSYPSEEKTRGTGIDWTSNLPLIIGIILGILLLLALILFLSSRRLGSSPNRAIASSSRSGTPSSASEERFADHSKDLNSFAASSARRSTPYDDKKYAATVINPTGPLLLNLYVEDQNTAIGKRNIHSLKSGYGFSVGGGKSDDYLIFLVPMPAAIGEIRRDGSTLTFTPKKAKYFPDIGSTPVRDCINKTIRIVSDKKYEMRFRFEMYEDPLIALNRVLMQVKVPGMV